MSLIEETVATTPDILDDNIGAVMRQKVAIIASQKTVLLHEHDDVEYHKGT
ncbi:hypothetical protein M404DRAFT_28014 [Pisolithus tinctorius Marx 270]|uniref:Uncharacterized protein n=1 Tax=Pisolithus tinctorius Marx 270 TaxID=870435 RepID=A0A0C3P576_PISTI|nr:hypothetical protein M404DRAFT_28014 [Pisolithus tinctorius Marx 270]